MVPFETLNTYDIHITELNWLRGQAPSQLPLSFGGGKLRIPNNINE